MLRFLGFITLLAVLVLAIGSFAGWFSFSDSQAGSRQDVTMRIDKGEIEQDIDDIKRKVNAVTEPEMPEQIVGDLVAADQATLEIELRSEARGTLRLKVAEDAAITLDGEEATLDQLRAGDHLVVRVAEATREVTHLDATRVG